MEVKARKAARIGHIVRLQQRLENHGFWIFFNEDTEQWYYMYKGKKDSRVFDFRVDVLKHLKSVCKNLHLNITPPRKLKP